MHGPPRRAALRSHRGLNSLSESSPRECYAAELEANGFLAPPILAVIMLIASDSTIIGDRVNGRWTNVVGWVTILAMSAADVGWAPRAKGEWPVRPYLVIFVSVFLAELGDKTQLATLLFATDPGTARLGVFLAAAGALVLSSLIAVVVGAQIGQWVQADRLRLIAGISFVAIGGWILVRS